MAQQIVLERARALIRQLEQLELELAAGRTVQARRRLAGVIADAKAGMTTAERMLKP